MSTVFIALFIGNNELDLCDQAKLYLND
jgi:hypothetical protein